VSKEDTPTGSGPAAVLGPAGLIAGNLSLIAAVMIYMGWAYDSSFYGYFHLGPVELGTSPDDYLLSSLGLFKPVIVVAVVVAIAAITLWTRGAHLISGAKTLIRWIARFVRTSPRFRWLNKRLRRLDQTIPQGIKDRLRDVKHWWKPKAIQVGLGAVVTVTALVLYAIAGDIAVSTYLVLALIAFGPLLLTSAFRGDRRGRVPYSLAIVVGIVCGLWAASLYASGLGNSAAQGFATHLSTKTEAAVYSVQPLALSGPKVSVRKLPAGFMYHYRYEGLRLLYISSGTYYLLPEGWVPGLPLTYIITASDQTRVELY